MMQVGAEGLSREAKSGAGLTHQPGTAWVVTRIARERPSLEAPLNGTAQAADIDFDILQRRADVAVAKQRLDDVQVAVRLFHQLSAQGMAESVRTHLVAANLGELLIEALHLPGVHRLHSVANAEPVHIEELLTTLDTHHLGRIHQVFQVRVKRIGDGNKVFAVVLGPLPGSGEHATFKVDILWLHQQQLSQTDARMVKRLEHDLPEPNRVEYRRFFSVELHLFIQADGFTRHFDLPLAQCLLSLPGRTDLHLGKRVEGGIDQGMINRMLEEYSVVPAVVIPA